MADLDAVAEIDRQIAALEPRDGFREGFSPSWSREQLTTMLAVRAQLGRLKRLRAGFAP